MTLYLYREAEEFKISLRHIFSETLAPKEKNGRKGGKEKGRKEGGEEGGRGRERDFLQNMIMCIQYQIADKNQILMISTFSS